MAEPLLPRQRHDSPLKCLVPGGGTFCQYEVGHSGAHYAQNGPGCTIWVSPAPWWVHSLGRWVQPDEPVYEQELARFRERMRGIGRPPRVAPGQERER